MDPTPAPPGSADKKDEEVKQVAVNADPEAAPEASKAAEVVDVPEAIKPADVVEDVPDPDEDDLDDLDDMLDEFSTVKLNSKNPSEPVASSAPGPSESTDKPTPAPMPAPAPAVDLASAPKAGPEATADEAFSEEDFAKQLQAGMADLLGELETSPDMKAQFEDIFKQMGSAAAGTDEPQAAAEAASKVPVEADAEATFQETIRRTMERMQSSGDQATAAAASGGGDDFMSEMLKQLSAGDLGGEGGEEDFSKMLMGMMEQLTNKEILYEPMKELDDKYPDWFEKNRASTPADDLKRYEEQRGLVAEIVAKFEESSYSDDKPADREYIVDRMQKMQAAGSPPADLVGDMASAQEAFNATDEQCNPQ